MKMKGLGRVDILRFYSRWRRCEGYKPRLLRMLVTSRCNSRCMHCNVWRLAKEKPHLVQDELSTQDWIDLLRELSEMGTEGVFISGGEPLLHKGLPDIIAFAKGRSMHVEMVTNGTLVTESLAKELVLSGLDIIDFSLDGPLDTHTEFRGVAGAWDGTTRGIGLLNQARKELAPRRPVIQVSYPVSNITHQHIEQMIGLKSALGYDLLHFNPILGKTPKAEALFMTDADLDNLESRLDSLAAGFRDAGMPEAPLLRLVRMCKNRAGASQQGKYAESLIGRVLCFAPWEETTVDPLGNVYPCPFACPLQNMSEDLEHFFWGRGDFTMGNIRDSRFSEIWNGDRYRQFRKTMHDFPSLPFCHWCCEASPRDAIRTGLFKTPWRLPGIAWSLMLKRFGLSKVSDWDIE